MPERTPRVGEIWEVPNTMSLGVVQEVVKGRTIILSQTGRSASMATSSFLLVWHFLRGPSEEPCSHEGCSSKAHLQMHSGGQWKWVCVEHILPGSDLRFEEGEENPIALEKCPYCGVSTSCSGSGYSEVADHFRMHWCGSCRCRWVLLVGSGTLKDRDWIPEALLTLREVFEEQECQDLHCFIGNQIANLMDSRVSILEGVPVSYTNHFGGSQVVITARGVDQPKEESWKKGTPVIGSIWWDNVNKDPFRVTSCYLIENQVFLTVLPKKEKIVLGAHQGFSLEDFQRTFSDVAPVIDLDPIQVGDLWSFSGKVHRITKVGINIILAGEEGEHTVEERIVRRTWTRIKLKPALERALEEDLF